MRQPDNRPDIRIVEAMVRDNAAMLNIKSGVVTPSIDSFIPAVASGVAGAVAGWSAGAAWLDTQAEGMALGCIVGFISSHAVYFVDRWLSTPRYRADYWGDDNDENSPPLMIPTGVNTNRLLTDDMRRLLVKFGTYFHHELIDGNFGVNKWEVRPAKIKRADLNKLYNYLRVIGALEGYGHERRLTEWGEGQLEKWADNQFDEIFAMEAE